MRFPAEAEYDIEMARRALRYGAPDDEPYTLETVEYEAALDDGDFFLGLWNGLKYTAIIVASSIGLTAAAVYVCGLL